MKRYNHHGAATTVEHPEGMWVLWEDVARLEASHAELLEAVKYMTRCTEACEDLLRDARRSSRLLLIRDAIAKAEGNVDPITDEEEVV